MNRFSLIIPAYKPDEKLLATLRAAIDAGAEDLIVVDDGGGADYAPIFDQVRALPQCTVLTHAVNRGKGAALKTAFGYVLEHRPEVNAVVTADADGQHLTEDILAVGKRTLETERITLGCRDFSGPEVPARSRFGNKFTIGTFRLFFGMKIRDTQTGLRGFPRAQFEAMVQIAGDRYEYETNMLFYMSREKLPFEQVTIQTVYLEENASSHFRPIRDSLRIYGMIIKYLLSSVAATGIDALAFFLLKQFAFLSFLPIPLTFTAAVLARIISSLINFAINAKVVFGGKPSAGALVRYYILAAVQIALSALCVFGLEHLFTVEAAWLSTLMKLVVDTILFFFSFRIQHKWVFKK